MPKVMVGLVGCGFVAELHMYAYKRVYGIDADVMAVTARGDHVLEFAKKHKVRKTYRDFRDLLDDPEIDVIDICTPPALHASMIVDAVRAGKHVICEKPFAGYFGRAGDKIPIGRNVPKSLMYERVLEEMEKTCAAIEASGQLFMYAEDWIYTPAVTKAVEILNSTKDKLMFMKAEEAIRLCGVAVRGFGCERLVWTNITLAAGRYETADRFRQQLLWQPQHDIREKDRKRDCCEEDKVNRQRRHHGT